MPKQYLGIEAYYDEKFDLIRQFNLLVEIHYRKEHQVQIYAGLLNKSPKQFLLFFICIEKTPTQIIQERIIVEAKDSSIVPTNLLKRLPMTWALRKWRILVNSLKTVLLKAVLSLKSN